MESERVIPIDPVCLRNLMRVKLIVSEGKLLTDPESRKRVVRLLRNRSQIDRDNKKVVLLVLTTNEAEAEAAKAFVDGAACDLAECHVRKSASYAETVAASIRYYAELVDSVADNYSAKRSTLILRRKGGKGKAKGQEVEGQQGGMAAPP